ncbi:LysR substrate-binding domain-containing protein [Riemerella columbipharyngis]|uniref:LysR family transcriptional regulator, hydrogen peroxide-inducible genes activator n=1 Tax=Riemerella columbipharyngis TaxID=1071918 RepID=A0A1G7F377_9FLAO|nr:LysR substrate-binding domain-containing protein [Riemerella columbipharyngis]SDE70374.1 LysR family transcriptional regulator, hydrogen peroxide-inducible genes activator [Riemerella columbipharyngis]
MNIQQLEYLIAVDKYKHFGKAAQACFITQPTLSAMIQKLEEELDVKIFDRSTHPIRTTDAGVQLIDHAQKIIDEVNNMKDKALSMNNSLAGKLSLGIIPTISPFILPTEIFGFLSQNKKIEMDVKEMNTDNVIKALKSSEIDAGIIATPYHHADEFFSDALFNEELMLYSSVFSERKKTDEFVLPDKIDVDKVWLLEEGNCLSTQFQNICKLKENHLTPKNLSFKASSISTLLQMVDTVGGLTLLPELAAKQLHESRQSKISRFQKPFPYREISLIYYKPTYKQKILDELVKYIRTHLRPLLNYEKSPQDYISIKPD